MAYLIEQEPEYRPNQGVREKLRPITLAASIGPVAVGKSTLIDKVTKLDQDFGRVQSFTIRERRNGEAESEYRWRPNNQVTITELAEQVRKGELVQYTVHPTTRIIYGSELMDYKQPFMLLDALASSMAALRKLPFKRMVQIAVVAEPEEWKPRFEGRNTEKSEAEKRLREGRASLEWSLDQGEEIAWVCNAEGRLEAAGREVCGLVRGEREPDPRNRRIGELLLQSIVELQEKM